MGALTFIGDVKHKGRQYLINQVLYFSMVIAFANSTWFPLSMLFLVGAGIFNSTSGVLANTLFQLAAKNEMRGRVVALLGMSQGVQPAGSLLMGFGIERWGAPGTISAFMAGAIGFMGLIAVAFPALRRSTLGAGKPEEPASQPPTAPREAAS